MAHVSRRFAVLIAIICCTFALATTVTVYAATDQRTAAPVEAPQADQQERRQIDQLNIQNIIHLTRLAQAETPSVTVSDQPIVDGVIVADEVVATQDSWAVVHTVYADASPIVDQVVGMAQVKAGSNADVRIELTQSFNPGDQLMVMLHIDEGTRGVLEFPSGPDAAVAVDDQIVASTFTVQEAQAQPDDEGAEQTATPVQEDQQDESAEPTATPTSEATEDEGAETTATPVPIASGMPNTGIGLAELPLYIIMAGLLLICAGIFRHFSMRNATH